MLDGKLASIVKLPLTPPVHILLPKVSLFLLLSVAPFGLSEKTFKKCKPDVTFSCLAPLKTICKVSQGFILVAKEELTAAFASNL